MHSRIGFGYDIHKLVKAKKLFLGGVQIPGDKGLEGHSDADVVLHTIIDAILGAAGLGDIGEHFPDTDKKYKNMSSAVLIKQVISEIKERKVILGNVDITIICQSPRLEKFKKLIRNKISKILNLPLGSINIKAKTNNGLGDTGKGKAIAAYAVVLLKDK